MIFGCGQASGRENGGNLSHFIHKARTDEELQHLNRRRYLGAGDKSEIESEETKFLDIESRTVEMQETCLRDQTHTLCFLVQRTHPARSAL